MPTSDHLIEAIARLGYRVTDEPADRGGRRQLVARALTDTEHVREYDAGDPDDKDLAATKLARACGVRLRDG